jgi:thiamine-phosphate pyrophosphorylase
MREVGSMTKTPELFLRVPADVISRAGTGAIALTGAAPAVFLVTGPGGTRKDVLRAFIAWADSQNAAVLIENDALLAKALDAGGVHLRAHSQPLRDVRALLGDDKVIGVSCPLSRHEAMEMAEEDADYIAFGEAVADGTGEVAEMIRWWDELFEVPCVAWVRDGYDEEDIGALREAGADFLALPGRCSTASGVLEIGAPGGGA